MTNQEWFSEDRLNAVRNLDNGYIMCNDVMYKKQYITKTYQVVYIQVPASENQKCNTSEKAPIKVRLLQAFQRVFCHQGKPKTLKENPSQQTAGLSIHPSHKKKWSHQQSSPSPVLWRKVGKVFVLLTGIFCFW